MTGAELAVMAALLDDALARSGICVKRGQYHAGNRVGWEDVDPHALLGVWLQRGWKIERLEEPQARVLPFTVER